MNIKQLRNKLDSLSWKYSSVTVDIADRVLLHLDEADHEVDADGNIVVYDIREYIWQATDEGLIYYDDAFKFLQETDITDFSEAIEQWNAQDVIGIAAYYIDEEVYELLLEIGLQI